MGILIFGTGGSTELYLEDNKEYFKNIDILAFVDNDKSKIGGQFKNKEIISPSDIFKYDFDIILICSVYEEEIYNQLVDKIKVLKQNEAYSIISNYTNEELRDKMGYTDKELKQVKTIQ